MTHPRLDDGPHPTLDEERAAFRARRFLAMPLAGTIAWSLAALAGLLLRPGLAVWALFILTGSIVYLGLFLSRFTGEDFLAKNRPKNSFDQLFFLGTFQALLVFSIAIPFFLVDYTSLPMTVGILSGLMWAPLSWIIQHWIGIFHAVFRTGAVLATWYLLPEHRFVAIPLVIVATYLFTMVVLERRWRYVQGTEEPARAAHDDQSSPAGRD